MLASIIVPVGLYHQHLAQRAVASAERQTVRCEVIVVEDRDGHGAGWARNRGIEQAGAPFVVFLDADDELSANFVEATALAYRPGHYVYTDFSLDGEHRTTAECARWYNGAWHPVTTLFPTAAARHIGGFDKALPGGEDRDFYLKALMNGICGLHVAQPLLAYSGDGQRSASFLSSPEYARIRQEIDQRYVMGCNCNKAPAPPTTGEQQPGDVLALVLYPPRKEQGLVSRRIYQRPLYQGQEMWVDPRDAEANPDLWYVKADPVTITPDVDTVLALAKQAAQ